jgi:hypothetical protein
MQVLVLSVIHSDIYILTCKCSVHREVNSTLVVWNTICFYSSLLNKLESQWKRRLFFSDYQIVTFVPFHEVIPFREDVFAYIVTVNTKIWAKCLTLTTYAIYRGYIIFFIFRKVWNWPHTSLDDHIDTSCGHMIYWYLIDSSCKFRRIERGSRGDEKSSSCVQWKLKLWLVMWPRDMSLWLILPILYFIGLNRIYIMILINQVNLIIESLRNFNYKLYLMICEY